MKKMTALLIAATGLTASCSATTNVTGGDSHTTTPNHLRCDRAPRPDRAQRDTTPTTTHHLP